MPLDSRNRTFCVAKAFRLLGTGAINSLSGKLILADSMAVCEFCERGHGRQVVPVCRKRGDKFYMKGIQALAFVRLETWCTG